MPGKHASSIIVITDLFPYAWMNLISFSRSDRYQEALLPTWEEAVSLYFAIISSENKCVKIMTASGIIIDLIYIIDDIWELLYIDIFD